MISRAILILKALDGTTRGVVKLTGDERGTRAELRVDGVLPDVLAIKSDEYLELVTVAGGNILLPPTSLARVEAACMRGDEIYLYGANCAGDYYSMERSIRDYLASLLSRSERIGEDISDTEVTVEDTEEDVATEVSLEQREGFTSSESPFEAPDVRSTESDEPIATDAESTAETPPLEIATDYEDEPIVEPIVEPEETLTTELYESVEVESEDRVGYSFGEIPIVMEEGMKDFYNSIKETLEELFVCFPEDKEIASLIPGRWVRVDSDGGYYVVGVIYEAEKPRYVCYGVPRVDGVDPPREIAPYCALVEEGEKGYWVMFQDADTGVNVRREDV